MRPKVPRLRKFEFMNLPAEIRNRIYDFLFDEFRVLVRGRACDNKSKKKPMWFDAQQTQLRKPGYRLECGFESSIINQDLMRCARSLVPTEMLQVSRGIYPEVIPLLYSRMKLRFESMKTLSYFLTHAQPMGIASVRKIEIVHAQYGEPLMLADREWKKRHNAKWLKLCELIGEEMKSLQELRIDFRICDWPTTLAMTAKWVQPLLKIRRAQLDRADIILRCSGIRSERLASFAKKLELEMMNDRGKRTRKAEERQLQIAELKKFEEKKAAEEEDKRKKALPMRILSVQMPTGIQTSSPNKPLPTKNPKLLTGYAKVPYREPIQWDD